MKARRAKMSFWRERTKRRFVSPFPLLLLLHSSFFSLGRPLDNADAGAAWQTGQRPPVPSERPCVAEAAERGAS